MLAAELRRRLGPPPDMAEWPLVSMIVPNRDGAGMLRRLLRGLNEHTDYPSLELVLVDNASSDDSLEFIRRVDAPFAISIVANPHNESFSDACNQGAELASGDLLLFLNNDVEPFESGWLRELVACRRRAAAAAVAATLVCLEEEHDRSFDHGYGIQHRGLEFREEDGMLVPALRGWEADPLDERLGLDDEPPAVAAACLLVERGALERVGGFSHGYVYGAEDVDLSLKLRDAGLPVLLSGRSVAIHHPVSTRRAAPFEEERTRKLANRRLLWERWGPRLRREFELDRHGGGGHYWPLGFCLKSADPAGAGKLEALADAIRGKGCRCLLLEGARAEDPIGLNYEVAVHLRGRTRYLPKPAQLNVLWPQGEAERTSTQAERSRYDIVLPAGEDADRLAARLLAEARSDRLPGAGLAGSSLREL
jgi:GT2 family glycosyltransferase